MAAIGLNMETPIEFTKEVHDKIDIKEMESVIKLLKKGYAEIVKTEHLLRGNGVKYFGESYYIEYLYTCELCTHKMKDCNKCGLDDKVHKEICVLFDKN